MCDKFAKYTELSNTICIIIYQLYQITKQYTRANLEHIKIKKLVKNTWIVLEILRNLRSLVEGVYIRLKPGFSGIKKRNTIKIFANFTAARCKFYKFVKFKNPIFTFALFSRDALRPAGHWHEYQMEWSKHHWPLCANMP